MPENHEDEFNSPHDWYPDLEVNPDATPVTYPYIGRRIRAILKEVTDGDDMCQIMARHDIDRCTYQVFDKIVHGGLTVGSDKPLNTVYKLPKVKTDISPEKIREKRHVYYIKNRERKRAYYVENREQILLQEKEYKSKPEVKERLREYNQCPEVKRKKAEYMSRYRKENQEKQNQYMREYYHRKKIEKLREKFRRLRDERETQKRCEANEQQIML